MCQPDPNKHGPKHTAKQSPKIETFRQRCTRWSKQARPFMCGYLLAIHLASLLAIVNMPSCKWQTNVLAFTLYVVGCLGITAGVHRLWAHKSYKATLSMRILLMIWYSIANQGTIYHWVRDHRVHHKHSETGSDPHDASRGLFFSHIGWLLLKKRPEVLKAGAKINMKDIDSDVVVKVQRIFNPWWNLLWCFFVPTATCAYCWDESVWRAFLVAGVLKYAVTLHATWCVNSFAHYFGERPYNTKTAEKKSLWQRISAQAQFVPAEDPPNAHTHSDDSPYDDDELSLGASVALQAISLSQTTPDQDQDQNQDHDHDHRMTPEERASRSERRGPAENPIVAILSVGEGWHNWHHAFPFDYACSELGVSEQFNPTKLLIDLFVKLGLASGRRRACKLWDERKKRWQKSVQDLDSVEGKLRQEVNDAKAAKALRAAPGKGGKGKDVETETETEKSITRLGGVRGSIGSSSSSGSSSNSSRGKLEEALCGLPLLRRRVVRLGGIRVEELNLPI